MTTRQWIVGSLGTVVVLVLTVLFIERIRDAHREDALIAKHQEIHDDSIARIAAMRATDTLSVRLDSALRAAHVANSNWHAATAHVATTVQTIVKSAKPDTVKIRELVYQIDTLVMRGDTLAQRDEALADTLTKFRVNVSLERAAWLQERNALASALKISEAMHRHWGFGCAGGGGVSYTPSGQIVAGPSVSCGIVYRR